MVSRRAFLAGGASVVALGAAGVAFADELPLPHVISRHFADLGPDGVIPDVPNGRIRLEQRKSAARGQRVGFWTAVPHGHGDGAGLPVCLILHGGSATTADYTAFGFGKYLTDVVQKGTPPFVLAGADGGLQRWVGGAGDDPQTMLRDEVPAWCEAQGFDSSRMAAYGWSMGGYGALHLAESDPDRLKALAMLSPALRRGEDAIRDAKTLDGERTALWCGLSDSFLQADRELARVLQPAIAHWSKGAHTRGYFNRVTPPAFRFVGGMLST